MTFLQAIEKVLLIIIRQLLKSKSALRNTLTYFPPQADTSHSEILKPFQFRETVPLIQRIGKKVTVRQTWHFIFQ